MGMIVTAKWDYKQIELKATSDREFDWDGVERLGEDGWEAVTFVPLPKPDPEGYISTTMGWMLLKRPKR